MHCGTFIMSSNSVKIDWEARVYPFIAPRMIVRQTRASRPAHNPVQNANHAQNHRLQYTTSAHILSASGVVRRSSPLFTTFNQKIGNRESWQCTGCPTLLNVSFETSQDGPPCSTCYPPTPQCDVAAGNRGGAAIGETYTGTHGPLSGPHQFAPNKSSFRRRYDICVTS